MRVLPLLAAAAVLTAPRWLPGRVVDLRVRVFQLVNGDRVVTLPNAEHGPEVFERVYADPAVNGRSRVPRPAARRSARNSRPYRPLI